MTAVLVQTESCARRRLLVVDDDEGVLSFLRRVLQMEGYEVDLAHSASEARTAVRELSPDLVILDLGLSDDDGLEVLTDIRANEGVPVIVLSGRAAEHDRVLGLRMGADDYVAKPCSYSELLARVESVLRRTAPRAAAPTAPAAPGVSAAGAEAAADEGLRVDPAAREVWLDGALVDTTAKEFDLLAFLVAAPRQVFSRHQLLERVWNSSSEWQDPATVTEHVRRLRSKIEREPDRPQRIVTVRGVGYRFEP